MMRRACSFCGELSERLLQPVSSLPSGLATCVSCVHLTVRVPLAGRGADPAERAIDSGYTAWSDGRFLYLAEHGELRRRRRRPLGIQPAP